MSALHWIGCLAVAAALQAQPSELSKFSSRSDVWPKEVTIKTAQAASKGQAAIPAGVTAKVVGLEGGLVGVEYQGAFTMIPAGQTDFVEKAAAALAQKPNPPARAPTPQPTPPPKPATVVRHALGDLENFLMFGTGEKIGRGAVNVAGREFILLQFGGGNRWGEAMSILGKAVSAARQRKASLEVLLVPVPGMTLPESGALMKENGGAWPMVDPGDERLLTALWTRYGHAGSFALALVDAQGRTVAATGPGQGRVDHFEGVITALNQLRPAP